MFTESDDAIRRLQHEKNVWRAIAIGLAATLVLLVALGAVGGILLATRSQHQAMRAEAAMMDALQQREQAERARLEAQRAAEKQKAKRP